MTSSLPDLFCPFTLRKSPFLEQVRIQEEQWVQAFGFFQSETVHAYYQAANLAARSCFTHPDARLEELYFCNNCYLWLGLIDDQFDESILKNQPERMNAIQAYLLALLQHNSPFLAEGPMARALVDLWRRGSTLTVSPIWKERFRLHLAQYFAACRREAEYCLLHHLPDLATYLLHRRDAAATSLCFDLIELCLHKSLEPAISMSQPLQERLQLAQDILGWTNDLFSLEKEQAVGKTCNLVLVIANQEHCTKSEALSHAGRLINERIRRYQSQLTDLSMFPSENRQDVSRFLHAITYWISGFLCWSAATARYQPGSHLSHFDPILPLMN
jgi:hypothetical protein